MQNPAMVILPTVSTGENNMPRLWERDRTYEALFSR
jgi:hypothetical protein